MRVCHSGRLFLFPRLPVPFFPSLSCPRESTRFQPFAELVDPAGIVCSDWPASHGPSPLGPVPVPAWPKIVSERTIHVRVYSGWQKLIHTDYRHETCLREHYSPMTILNFVGGNDDNNSTIQPHCCIVHAGRLSPYKNDRLAVGNTASSRSQPTMTLHILYRVHPSC